MKLRKPVRLTHQSKCNRADRTSDIFQAQSTDLTWAYTAWPSRGLRAREVRQAIIWPSRKGQGYYGSAQTITRRCRSSLDLSAFAKGPASRISRAPGIRRATKMNIENEAVSVNSTLFISGITISSLLRKLCARRNLKSFSSRSP